MGDPVQFLKKIYDDGPDKTRCNSYFIEVARQLGILGPGKTVQEGTADKLIDDIYSKKDKWYPLGEGATGGSTAATMAGMGYLVVAVLRAKDSAPRIPPVVHGHVAFVLPKGSVRGYPYVISYGGINGNSDGSKWVYSQGNPNKSVWGPHDAPKVQYLRTFETFPQLKPGR